MKRGDIITISAPGDYGKPRPAVVIQSDRFLRTKSVLVCPMTTTEVASPLFRLLVAPLPETGLREMSYAMTEKLTPIQREKCGPVMGRLSDQALLDLDEMLAVITGLAD